MKFELIPTTHSTPYVMWSMAARLSLDAALFLAFIQVHALITHSSISVVSSPLTRARGRGEGGSPSFRDCRPLAKSVTLQFSVHFPQSHLARPRRRFLRSPSHCRYAMAWHGMAWHGMRSIAEKMSQYNVLLYCDIFSAMDLWHMAKND